MTNVDIPARLLAWHRRKFPEASTLHVGLKLAEETGEVCQAIDRIIYGRVLSNALLEEELGDVGIVLTVLCERFIGKSLAEVIASRAETVMVR